MSGQSVAGPPTSEPAAPSADRGLLEAREVTRRFRARARRAAFGRPGEDPASDGGARLRDEVVAVDGVSLRVRPGETVGLVGESGSGKSTLGRLLVGLDAPDSGSIWFEGRDVAAFSKRERRSFARRVQIVFQDPQASLNPRLTAGAMLREVLTVHRLAAGAAVGERVAELLDRVGIAPEAASRHPHEFSGGQRQRLGIARALAVRPDIVVADEPVSALDVSVQARILGLLLDLQTEYGIGYVFISHDLAVVRQVADRVAVMRAGRVIESGSVEEVYGAPREPYTMALLKAVPRLHGAT